MDGFKATRRIREEEEFYGVHIPIIALTAHTTGGEEANRMIQAGMDFHLTKPLSEQKLLEAILLRFPLEENPEVLSLSRMLKQSNDDSLSDVSPCEQASSSSSVQASEIPENKVKELRAATRWGLNDFAFLLKDFRSPLDRFLLSLLDEPPSHISVFRLLTRLPEEVITWKFMTLRV
ncbi:hypothetical protein RJ639_033558 [Escallonia herrerae]|uniref:histidine kinase n=1 Tax=Escallonia herrerae TaxID=1293975 RepID=A0AA89BBP4_9ASTE|nr:hypothetical protein RJ639_033558 [Escallonia herrerae]